MHAWSGYRQGKNEVKDYEEAKDRLLVTGNIVSGLRWPISSTASLSCSDGDSFPLLTIPGGDKMTNATYIVHIPSRENNGSLTFKKGYLRSDEDVHRGFLPYTQENVAHQGFKMLGHPYGWGDMFGGRDCSRFIMDLFRTFGILMPRTQKNKPPLERISVWWRKTYKRKKRKLDQAFLWRPPFDYLVISCFTWVRIKGRHYVIHSIWGIQTV